MAFDQYGNYVAGLTDDTGYVTPQNGNGVQIGVGVPDENTPISILYVVESTGATYSNPSQTPDGWILISGGGGTSIAQVIISNADNPNDASIVPDDPSLGAIFYQDPDAAPYNLWYWSVAQGAWVQLISPA